MTRLALAALALFALTASSRADAIDGEWCSPKGLHLKIAGTSITIPSGVAMTGDYHRHSFAYQPPKGDADEGATVIMRLLSEEEMEFYRMRGGELGAGEVWTRCQVTS
jgi:hypothetical protein